MIKPLETVIRTVCSDELLRVYFCVVQYSKVHANFQLLCYYRQIILKFIVFFCPYLFVFVCLCLLFVKIILNALSDCLAACQTVLRPDKYGSARKLPDTCSFDFRF